MNRPASPRTIPRAATPNPDPAPARTPHAMPTDTDSTTAHLRHGVKTGLATLLAWGTAQALGLQFGYWAALSTVIVMQLSVADSMQMCWYRLSGTAIGAGIGIGAILAFPETPLWTAAGLFLAVGFCAFMTRYNARYRMAAITACIVMLASLGQEERLLFGLERVLEIGIGVASAFVVTVTLWPLRVGTNLRERLRRQFFAGAGHYGALVDAFLRRQAALDPAPLDAFAQETAANRALHTKVLRHERRLYHDDTDQLRRMVRTLDDCTETMRGMLLSLNAVSGEGYDILMEPELRELADATMEVMRAVGRGRCPVRSRLEAALARADERLEELRAQGATRRFYLHKLMQFLTFFHGLRRMGQILLRHCGP